MKKAVLALMVMSCLFASSLKDYRLSVEASLVVIHVPLDFPTIQEAINNASSGATILVRNGTYVEHIFINKSIALVGESRDFTIIDDNETGDAVYIMASNVSISGFTIMRSIPNSGRGIFVENFGNSTIYNSKIIGHNEGIGFNNSDDNVVSGNTISSNDFAGVHFYSSRRNVISDNIILNNGGEGIRFHYSDDNVVSGNTISSNDFAGLNLDSSSRNVISSNDILRNNGYGINFFYSVGNVIYSNNISSNYEYGIYAIYSNNNTAYHNNFENIYQVLSGLANVWSYNSEGNYWSDYDGRDSNGDGIGDNPYIIDGSNRDNFPLMGMFYDFNVTFENKGYNVTIISNSTISDFKFEIVAETRNRIIRFNVTFESGSVGFSRVTVPKELMDYPYIVLLDSEEVTPTVLNTTDEASICLYLTYSNNCSISIIYSEVLHLYYDLLAKYSELEENLSALNEMYNNLLNNFTGLQEDFSALNATYYDLLDSYNKLQADLSTLNATYHTLQDNYNELQMNLNNLTDNYYSLLGNYSLLQTNFNNLTNTYYSFLTNNYTLLKENFRNLDEKFHNLLEDYSNLLGNYTGLQRDFSDVNASYQQHLVDYSEQMQNIRSLMYIFAATTAVFIVTTIYLSKKAHSDMRTKIKTIEEEK